MIISYKDGDGDIGTEDPDEYTLLIHDSRLPAADEYHIQPLTPPSSKIQIEGELQINLAGLFVLGRPWLHEPAQFTCTSLPGNGVEVQVDPAPHLKPTFHIPD